jgi:hypothetical protein
MARMEKIKSLIEKAYKGGIIALKLIAGNITICIYSYQTN